MERKKAEELYGKILLTTKQIRTEIMNEVADVISFGGTMSEEDARELQNAARITGCAFDALIKRGVPVEEVGGKDDLVKMKLNDGEFVCSKRVMGIHESQTPAVHTQVIKEKESVPVKKAPVNVQAPKEIVTPVGMADTFVKEELPVREEKEIPKDVPVREEISSKEDDGFMDGMSDHAFPPEDYETGESEMEEESVIPSTAPIFARSEEVHVSEGNKDDFQDEHRKHKDMFIFHNYRISIAHANSMMGEEMSVNIAPLVDYKGSAVFSVPIIVSIFYKGKMTNRSTYDMENGRTMVQIGVGDFYFLCRGEFAEDGTFKTTITTTGASADNGDMLTVVSCEKYGSPHNTGANHMRFHYLVDSDTNEYGVIEVFPLELEEAEYIVMCRTDDYTDYYHVSSNQTGSGNRNVTVYEDNVKKELVLNWDGKFMEAELVEG